MPKTGDRIIRVSATAAVLVVAAVAAFVSYLHAVAVIADAGAETKLTAHLIPLTTDGMIFTSSMVTLWATRYGLRTPALARWALGLGIVATITLNSLHGLSHGPRAAVLSAMPAVALVVAYHLLMWIVRAGRELADDSAPSQPQADPNFGTEAPKIRETPEPWLTNPAVDDAGQRLANSSTPDIAAEQVGRVQVDESMANSAELVQADVSGPVELHVVPDVSKIEPETNMSDGHVESADRSEDEPLAEVSESDRIALVTALLADNPKMSGAKIGQRLGLTARQGQRIRNAALASMNGKAV